MRGMGDSGTRPDWIEFDSATALVALGDVVLIVLLMAGGLLAHAVDPLADLRYTMRTALPFVIGWAIAAPTLGAYSRLGMKRVSHTVVVVVAAWTAAAVLGAALRASTFFPGDAPTIFVLVTVGTGLLVLLPWRVAVWFVRSG